MAGVEASAPVVTSSDVAGGVRALGLADQALCIHVSMRSFGRLEAGARTVVDGLLEAGCTVLVPTFSHQFAVAPPADDRPSQNGFDYSEARESPGLGRVFAADAEVEPWLGAVPAHVVTRGDLVRCGNPGSFGAVGPLARDLIVESPGDIFGPLRALAGVGGGVVLMAVGLNRMTLLHLAEVVAGRRPFVRWVSGSGDVPMRIGVGECSEGFPNLESSLRHLVRTTMVGASRWEAFPAAETVAVAAEAIRSDPQITHCGRDCVECRDAIAGGPWE